jgi:chaperonin cofactor prefoldin
MIEPQIQSEAALAMSRQYLAPPPNSFWRWTDAGQTLEWIGGPTIAFAPELQKVLASLAMSGLPPIGAVVLLLSACRDNWPQRAASIQFETDAPAILPEILASLAVVHSLPADLRKTIDAKCVLAEMVFEELDRKLPPDQSQAIVQAFTGGITFETSATEVSENQSDKIEFLPAELRALREGLRRIDPHRLEARIRTGLDEPPNPAAVALSAAERVRSLLKTLSDDRELAALSRLASNLMAAIAIPRALADRDDLPQGGVSDLTNRGPLDRLLVSELAHDDQTLAVRIALNEALYLRRESPPRHPPQRRAILLDSGIRLWGVGRVFAAATALALVATTQHNCELFTFRASSNGITPVDLTTRAGLLAHLEALEPAPQPSGALQAFFAAISDAANNAGEAMLITHEDVLSDPDFILECGKHQKSEWFIATISQSGSLRLWHQGPGGRRPFSQAKLSLDEIQSSAAPKQPVAPLIDGPDPHLPVILSSRPFAFLLPQFVEPRMAAASQEHGLVGLTKDGRLLHWPYPNHGGRQLTDTVPRGRCHGVFLHELPPRVTAIIQPSRGANNVMLTANLSNGRWSTQSLATTQTHPTGMAVWGELLLIIYRTNVEAISIQSGQFIARAALPPGASHQGGRIFAADGAAFTVNYDGQRLWLEKLPVESRILRYFDSRGTDGPLGLMRDGRIIGPGQKWIRTESTANIKRVLGISASGHRIAVNCVYGVTAANYLIDLRNDDGWKKISGEAQEALLAPEIFRSTRSGVSLRHNFQGIYHRDGELALLSKKDHILTFSINRNGEMILQDRGRPGAADGKPVRFSPAAGPPGTRYELGVAAWKDRSRAYLDSRGLLHLKSSDPTLPEISIVLSNGPLAGWSSDFERFGDPFFFNSAPTSTAANFLAAIRAFCARLR